MKILNKFFACILCVTVLSVMLFGNVAYANQLTNEKTIEGWRCQAFDDLTDSQQNIVLSELYALGLSEDEVDEIIALDREYVQSNSLEQDKIAPFSMMRKAAPKIGDRRTKYYSISSSDIAQSAAITITEIIKLLVKKKIPAAIASGAAPYIAEYIESGIPFKKISIKSEQVYGYQNDGVTLGWVLGPITVKLVK